MVLCSASSCFIFIFRHFPLLPSTSTYSQVLLDTRIQFGLLHLLSFLKTERNCAAFKSAFRSTILDWSRMREKCLQNHATLLIFCEAILKENALLCLRSNTQYTEHCCFLLKAVPITKQCRFSHLREIINMFAQFSAALYGKQKIIVRS